MPLKTPIFINLTILLNPFAKSKKRNGDTKQSFPIGKKDLEVEPFTMNQRKLKIHFSLSNSQL
jgi:hypothetical protein